MQLIGVEEGLEVVWEFVLGWHKLQVNGADASGLVQDVESSDVAVVAVLRRWERALEVE